MAVLLSTGASTRGHILNAGSVLRAARSGEAVGQAEHHWIAATIDRVAKRAAVTSDPCPKHTKVRLTWTSGTSGGRMARMQLSRVSKASYPVVASCECRLGTDLGRLSVASSRHSVDSDRQDAGVGLHHAQPSLSDCRRPIQQGIRLRQHVSEGKAPDTGVPSGYPLIAIPRLP
jgi:hypothetical protein